MNTVKFYPNMIKEPLICSNNSKNIIIHNHACCIKNSYLNISPYNSEYKSFDFWHLLKGYLPGFYNEEKLLGILTDKITLEIIPSNSNPSRKLMEPFKYEIFNTVDSISLLTVFIFLKSSKHTNESSTDCIRIYDKKDEGIFFTNKDYDFYNIPTNKENILLISNKIWYQYSPSKEDRYILKIPIFYTDSTMK
jgi:hypothetical protein